MTLLVNLDSGTTLLVKKAADLAAEQTLLRTIFLTGSQLAVHLVAAIAIAVVTLWLAERASRVVKRAMGRLPQGHASRDTLQGFLSSLARYGVLLIGLVAALQVVGVEATTIVAVLGAASLAIGLALQGALGNVAAGVMILLFRPYRVGDVIETQNRTGTVRTLDLFVTELTSFDNLKIVVPNSKVFGDVITNFTQHDTRRVDALVRLPVHAPVISLMAELETLVSSYAEVASDPAPVVEITGMGDTWVEVAVRAWVGRANFVPVKARLLRAIRQKMETVLIPVSDLNAETANSVDDQGLQT